MIWAVKEFSSSYACCFAGSAPLGMIGVTPPPHKAVLLAAKADKVAQEMKRLYYENGSTNGRTEQVCINITTCSNIVSGVSNLFIAG